MSGLDPVGAGIVPFECEISGFDRRAGFSAKDGVRVREGADGGPAAGFVNESACRLDLGADGAGGEGMAARTMVAGGVTARAYATTRATSSGGAASALLTPTTSAFLSVVSPG